MNKITFKQNIDFLVSIFLVALLSPIIFLIHVLILTTMGRPTLFTQMRPGLNGRVYKIFKFRTMTNKKCEDGKLLPEKTRITKLGNLLRKSSLDELPELLNVLRGDMSLVGPRPLLVEYLPLYSSKQMKRHEVRPGITGLAQINGRNNLSWNMRFDFDLWYVNNWSIKLDIHILFMTVKKVVSCQDVTIEGYFTGNSLES